MMSNVLKRVQAGCLPWGFCLLGLATSSALNTAKGSLPATARVSSRLLERHSSAAGFVSALGSKSDFVSAPGDGHLYINDTLFDFRSFNSPTIFEGGEFQGRDLIQTISAFGSPVTRTYTLHVANTMFTDGREPPSSSHILGWDDNASDWIYNETNWRKIDKILDLSRQYGIRLIIPIINQDYGTSGTNWVGNFNDLIRHRYGIEDYTVANQAVDWFTDPEMIRSYKQIIAFFLNRINTFNGIRIGNDETVLAFETGNEMNWGDKNQKIYKRAAPASWTIEIAQHIKSLAPKTLVMDGSFSRNPSAAWNDEVLDSPFVDLFSYHFYGTGDTRFYKNLQDLVQLHEKTFIVGEHGFYEKAETYEAFYKNITCAGAFVWSLLPHSEKGGFLTHGEGHNIFAYHAPGFKNQTSKNFDTQEAEVISSTYNASYRILGLEPPPKPVPGPPEAFLLNNGTTYGISWRGSAWAQRYQILGAGAKNKNNLRVISKYIPDNVDAGQLFIPLKPNEPTKPIKITLSRPVPKKLHTGWVDNKWCAPESPASCPKKSNFSRQDNPEDSISYPGQPFDKGTIEDTQKLHSPVQLGAIVPEDSSSGGWFAVRAISADGVPGKISKPVFLKT
ncbi:hypothetical protein PTTG_02736 [Puccinia triticina 1-1 BBBD Race 1]|uniref:mannan endo-1,4-beta-mannosidase n=1 Tax=Puccinia triticina (isolate 1-1 / race 1 (BBBD)) TaxID=630390 RepID=A0A0C4EPN3_PUCT1|nr:hypothetical protein PTTG_02736 [Puccinia triticina 1-1 BBBD Race 1]